jgi:hypothetical protein
MEYARSTILFFVGIFVASVFFIFGWDRPIERLLHIPHFDSIGLAIVPSGAPSDCPESYAIDNRTDRVVSFTMADAGGGYMPPDSGRWGAPAYSRNSYSTRSSIEDMGPLPSDSVPDSSEPGVRASDDAYPEDSNYGGSLSEYGGDRPRQYEDRSYDTGGYDNSGGGSYSYDSRNAYGSRSNTYNRASSYQPSRDIFASGNGAYPPPPAGQSIPLTPPDNSSPYGAPPVPGYGDQRDGGYGAPQTSGYGDQSSGYGPPANNIRPHEIFFSPTVGGQEGPDGGQGCNGADNTVTVQLSN